MTFGLEVDFNHLNTTLVKWGLDVVYASVFVILFGLLIRVNSGKTPFWYVNK